MDKNQISKKVRIPVVDFAPAEIKKGKQNIWRIEFYVWNPNTQKMKRFQRRVKPMANTRQRERFAKRMAAEINNKLERGWNPLIEMEASHSFALLTNVLDRYISNIKKQAKDGSIRPDTLRSYTSFTKNIREWVVENYGEDVFCLKFNKKMVSEFLDCIYYQRNNSPRTYNNYLSFIFMLSEWMLQKDYIKANPAPHFKKKKVGEKIRQNIPDNTRKKIFEYFKKENIGMYCLVNLMYFQLVRRTEITRLKVGNILLIERSIHIPAQVSKTDNESFIAILNAFLPILVNHIEHASNSDYLFSENFLPGKLPISPKSISDEWARMRKILKIKKEYQLYSLKDTGISNLLNSGVPPLKVRDHARHSALAMTEKYTKRNNAEDINRYAKNFS